LAQELIEACRVGPVKLLFELEASALKKNKKTTKKSWKIKNKIQQQNLKKKKKKKKIDCGSLTK
jgi:hypothetical protein